MSKRNEGRKWRQNELTQRKDTWTKGREKKRGKGKQSTKKGKLYEGKDRQEDTKTK